MTSLAGRSTTIVIPPIKIHNDVQTDITSQGSSSHFLKLLGSKELVLLELQGSISRIDSNAMKLGKLLQEDDGRIFLIVGYQKLEGKVVDLKLPFAVLRRKRVSQNNTSGMDIDQQEEESIDGKEVEMEVVEVCRKKLYFNSRPEPLNEMDI